MKNQKLPNLILLIFVGLSLVACGGASAVAVLPTDTPIPPTDTLIPPTDTPIPPTDTPAPPTDTPVPPTDTPPTSSPTPDITVYLQMDFSEGDPLRGRNAAIRNRCFGCHVDPGKYGPLFAATNDLPGIKERGEFRIADPAYEGNATTNQEYILESIFLPEVYILPGEWEEAMPTTFHLRITDMDLANIMAWIESLE